MQELIEYLKTNTFESLTDNYGLLVKPYNNGELYNISYTNWASPKFIKLVEACRGIVIDKDLNVLVRPFDRFYNYGENPNQEEIDLADTNIFDKIDGSLVKVWWYPKENRWCVGTRGTAFAERENEYDTDYRALIYRALNITSDNEFNILCEDQELAYDETHLFELTSPYNRVVVNYDGIKLHYLNSRNIITGEYNPWSEDRIKEFGVEVIQKFDLKTMEELKDFNSKFTIDDLKEGFIICDSKFRPVLKLKADLYVHMHYLRGEGLAHRRMVYMLIRNDHDEYLTYFPNDKPQFERYIDTWDYMIADLMDVYRDHEGKTAREVSTAMEGDFRVSAVVGMLKSASHGHAPLSFLDVSLEKYRYKLFMNYFNKLGHKVIDYV